MLTFQLLAHCIATRWRHCLIIFTALHQFTHFITDKYRLPRLNFFVYRTFAFVCMHSFLYSVLIFINLPLTWGQPVHPVKPLSVSGDTICIFTQFSPSHEAYCLPHSLYGGPHGGGLCKTKATLSIKSARHKLAPSQLIL